jgi:hypothetical protein
MYYYSTKAYFEGLDPYDAETVSAVAGKRILEYFYFPLSFYLFRPFISIDYSLASYIFLGLKCILLIALLFVWQRFLQIDLNFYFCLFCIFAFNSTIYLDLMAGNISIIEQFLVWTAFLNLMRDRIGIFCLLIGFSALFKVNMLIFGLITLLMPSSVRWKGLIYFFLMPGAAVLMCAIIDLPTFVRFASRWFQVMAVQWDVGIINPSSYVFVMALVEVLNKDLGIHLPGIAPFAIYIAWVILIVSISWRLISKLDVRKIEHRRIILMLFCVVYALAIPRFKDYSYILLIPPAYFIMSHLVYTKPYALMFILCILSATIAPLPGANVVASILWTYYPFFLGVMVWLLYVFELRKQQLEPESLSHDAPANTDLLGRA